jgi:hypothetical protein
VPAAFEPAGQWASSTFEIALYRNFCIDLTNAEYRLFASNVLGAHEFAAKHLRNKKSINSEITTSAA